MRSTTSVSGEWVHQAMMTSKRELQQPAFQEAYVAALGQVTAARTRQTAFLEIFLSSNPFLIYL
jgi:hypothetical protein